MNAKAASDRDHADRDVDEEDPVPVDVLGDQAADERADREGERGDAGPDADRRSPLLRRERDSDDRERRRVHQRRAEPLDDARRDQERRVTGQAAREGREREDGEADDEHPAPAEKVGELAAREHESPEGEGVPGDHPLELGHLEVERLLDGGQRHVHDRVVEHDHEEAERRPLPASTTSCSRPRKAWPSSLNSHLSNPTVVGAKLVCVTLAATNHAAGRRRAASILRPCTPGGFAD